MAYSRIARLRKEHTTSDVGIVGCAARDNRRQSHIFLQITRSGNLTLLEYFAACEMNREYNFSAQSEMDQYFLRNPTKIRQLIRAGGVLPSDRVVELGAGIGSVARHFPTCKSLTLLDLDSEVVQILHYQFPDARVIRADAVAALPALEFDVIFTNLPFFLTVPILGVLGNMTFRTAIMSVRGDEELELPPTLRAEDVGILDEDDFFPRQPFKSKVIRVVRKT
jgi:hypothetical protein